VTSIDGGASGNFSSSGPEPFGIEDIDASGAAASIASKSKFAAKEEEIEKTNRHKLKGVTVETALMVILTHLGSTDCHCQTRERHGSRSD
jgi:hypothetical protein